MPAARLTNAQRRLVEDNMGLVGLHLRRFVTGLDHPTRDREWDDLFQEGCIGLTVAARTYPPGCDIPFAPFALRRIHAAVGRALHRAFTTIRTPLGDAPRRAVQLDERTMRHGGMTRHRAAPEAAFVRDDGEESIGERIAARILTAVTVAQSQCDEPALAAKLVATRILVPAGLYRKAVREIMREERANYSRVVRTEKRLLRATRAALNNDTEFQALVRHARTVRGGFAAPVDDAALAAIDAATGARIAARAVELDGHDRGKLLDMLMTRTGCDAGAVIGRLVRSLDAAGRRDVLRSFASGAEGQAALDRAERRRPDALHGVEIGDRAKHDAPRGGRGQLVAAGDDAFRKRGPYARKRGQLRCGGGVGVDAGLDDRGAAAGRGRVGDDDARPVKPNRDTAGRQERYCQA